MVASVEPRDDVGEVIDWTQLAGWGRRHRIVLGGLALIAAQLVWKGIFLSHFFFRQDDFHYLDRALNSGFSWKYLSYIGSGHLQPGSFAIAWVLARISLYNWGLAAAVNLVILAGAGVAALRLLRTLFGDRPAILVPLTVYLLTPLTLPDLGYWSSAIESLPLQLAIFMTLNAHVVYVRTRRLRHLAAAAAWLLVGLIFFEKAIVLPLVLFAVTSGFLLGGPWLAAARLCAVRFWRAWLLYGAMLIGYLALLTESLRGSTVQPGTPSSLHGALTFTAELVKDTFVPGAIGGPWQWFPSPDGTYAYSAPPAELTWLSVIVAVMIVAASIWARRSAWQAWAILAGWIAAADVAPVLIGRIDELSPALLGFETRYVADAAPLLAICVGLAFWPVLDQQATENLPRRRELTGGGQLWNAAAAAVFGAFVVGSLWSVQAYLNVTSSAAGRTYIANARAALAEAPNGTVVFPLPVPPSLMLGIYGQYDYSSQVIGAMEGRDGLPARLRWTTQPDGTVDNLLAFGPDGRLHQAKVYGRTSVPVNAARRCWPVSNGQIVVPFPTPSGPRSQVLGIDYLASTLAAAYDISVTYGGRVQLLALRPGLHSAYLPEQGSAAQVIVQGPGVGPGLCIGDVRAGILVPSKTGPATPAISR